MIGDFQGVPSTEWYKNSFVIVLKVRQMQTSANMDGNDHSFPAYAGPVARASTRSRQRAFFKTRASAVHYEFNIGRS